MKKIIRATLVLLICIATGPVMAKLRVFACEPEWAALAGAVGGDQLILYSATTAQQDPHHIQARPSLIARVRRADLLVCTGADLEIGWLPLLLRKSGNAKVQPGQPGHFMATEHVTLLEKPARLDRSLGDVHAAGNPHIHLDPHRLLQVAEALTRTLSGIDAENTAHYRKNFAAFKGRWEAAIEAWKERVQPLRGKRIVVHHQSWPYLERWLGLQRVATLEPKPGVPPSGGHLARVLDDMRKQPADMILYADYQDDRAARWLSEKTGIKTVALPFSVDDDGDLIQWFEALLGKLLETAS